MHSAQTVMHRLKPVIYTTQWKIKLMAIAWPILLLIDIRRVSIRHSWGEEPHAPNPYNNHVATASD